MKVLFTFLLAAAVFMPSLLAQKARFDNYRVFSFDVESDDQATFWHQIEEQFTDYDFWSSAKPGREASVMVPPHKLADFSELAALSNTTFSLKVENVQALIDAESPQKQTRAFGWTAYGTWQQIYEWLDQQVAKYPNILTNYVIGTSHENRPIRAVKISYKAGNPVIFIEANVHAREWVTSATATWLINELLTSRDAKVRDIAENFDWVIIPIFNIDGFSYSHSNNRMWRKTRQPHNVICPGTDGNRNFDFHWNTVGASSFPCAETYAGPRAFSEPETRAFASFLDQFASRTKILLSFHSFGQYFMWPYGHTTKPTENNAILNQIARKTVAAIARRYGTDYLYGSSSTVLYATSGSNVDWAYDKYGIKLAYIFEFRDRRNGQYGFILPANQIIPNCLEILDGLIALIDEARVLNQV